MAGERRSVRSMAKIALVLQGLCLVAGLGLAAWLMSRTGSIGWALLPIAVFGALGASTALLPRCPSCDVPVPHPLVATQCPRCGESLE